VATLQQDGLMILGGEERRQLQHFASKTDTEGKEGMARLLSSFFFSFFVDYCSSVLLLFAVCILQLF
jgi:hypothetical protein